MSDVPTMNFRFVKREAFRQSFDEAGSRPERYTINILQQMFWVKGWPCPEWRDVPVVDEQESRRTAMTSETDEQFLDGLIGRPITVSDRVRLFALARRGAAVDDIVDAAMQAIDHVSRFNSPERMAEARAMVRKAAGEQSDE